MKRLGFLLLTIIAAMVLSVIIAIPIVADEPDSPAAVPASVSPELPDYAPGDTVILTGSGFQPGETVNISAVGSTNKSNPATDVVAADDGSISASLVLPDEYEKTYSVTATGVSGTASTSFTDSTGLVIQTPSKPVTLAPGQKQEYQAFAGNQTHPANGMTLNFSIPDVHGDHTTGGVCSPVQGVTGQTGEAKGYLTTYYTAGMSHGRFAVVVVNVDDSSNSASQFVDICGVSLTASPNPAATGQSVTLTVTSEKMGNGYASGIISFFDGSTFLGTGTFNDSGIATLTASFSTMGIHNISAYAGSSAGGDLASSPMATTNLTVANPETTTTLSAGPNGGIDSITTTYGQQIDFTATVSALSGTPTGTVTFSGPFAADTENLVSGIATFSTSAINAGGPYTVTATYSGGGGFNGSSATYAVTVNQATANFSISGYTGIYDGNAHGATGTATGVGSIDLSASLNLGGTFTDVPGGTAHWTFTGGTNYKDASGDVAIVINQTAATVTVNGYTGVYDSKAHGATCSATGVKGEDLSSLLDLGASFTDVPGGTASWTFAGNTNYKPASGSVQIVINKADATIAVTGYTGVYDGDSHGATGTATGVGSIDLSASLNLGGTFTDVPGGTAHWTFTGGTNYKDASGDAAITITKADVSSYSVDGWTGIYDGNAHGASGKAVGVKGETLSGFNFGQTFTDVPGGTAKWSFSNTNYNDLSGSVEIVISQADATIAVTGYTGVYDGNTHGATGSATGVKGENLSSLLDLGASFTDVPGGTASWTFAGNTNYKPASGSVAITINKATPKVTVDTTGSPFTYDTKSHGASASVTGVGGSTLSGSGSLVITYNDNSSLPVNAGTYNGNSSLPVNAGTYNVVASFTSQDNNYDNATGNGSLVINKAPTYVTWNNPVDIVYGTALDATQLNATASVPGSFKYTPAAGTMLNAGLNQKLHVDFTPTDSGNYLCSSADVYINVKKAPIHIEYTGLQEIFTASPTTYTTTVTSSVALTCSTGDISTATVIFGGDIANTMNVGKATTTTGSAVYQWKATIPSNSTYASFTITFTVGGNYYADETSEDSATVNVALPSQTSFITGGGYLKLTSATAGNYAGTVGSKANFGFNVKYNKSNKNLQGNVNIIVRQGATVYQFKSNALNNLTTSGNAAVFTSKGNGQSWSTANPNVITPLGGNWTIQLQMHDLGEPGSSATVSPDTLGITVWDGTGALMFSSNWSGKVTNEQALMGGNLQVH